MNNMIKNSNSSLSFAEILNDVLNNENALENLGNEFLNCIYTDDEAPENIAEHMVKAYLTNDIDKLLIAICGYSLGTLLTKAGIDIPEKVEKLSVKPEDNIKWNAFISEHSEPDEGELVLIAYNDGSSFRVDAASYEIRERDDPCFVIPTPVSQEPCYPEFIEPENVVAWAEFTDIYLDASILSNR